MPPYAELLAGLSTYGYVAVFLGAIFEGEAIMTLSGLFIQQGHLLLPAVFALAMVGTILGDDLWFLVGRYRFPRRLHETEWFQKFSARPVAAVNSNPRLLAFCMRFMYGFRTLIPLGLGMSSISGREYFFYHALGAMAWVSTYITLGYFFGGLLEVLFGRIKHPELIMIAVVVLLVVCFITIGKLTKRFFYKKLIV